MKKSIDDTQLASWLLRVGLTFVFLYAGVSSLQHPLEWIGFLPAFLTKAITATALLKIMAVYELTLAAWLISGKWLKYSALLCAITLVGIILANSSQLITTFRDIGLAFMALALFIAESSYARENRS
jgi:uncharacterized membrane protein YphA (DoxX/SURF4 family)